MQLTNNIHITWELRPNNQPSNSYSGIITYAEIISDVGQLFVAQTSSGICQLDFVVNNSIASNLCDLEKNWSRASFRQDRCVALPETVTVRSLLQNPPPLHLSATAFQRKVWQSLLKIPTGKTATYGDIASDILQPRAAQAVGQAVGANPVAIVVPCHRVINANGQSGNYHWGTDLKQRLLIIESLDAENALL